MGLGLQKLRIHFLASSTPRRARTVTLSLETRLKLVGHQCDPAESSGAFTADRLGTGLFYRPNTAQETVVYATR